MAEKIIRNTNISFDTISIPSHEGRSFRHELGSQHPNKKSRNFPLSRSLPCDRSSSIRNILYKTRLCEFGDGTCPFKNNCNYAHGVEELRKRPPNSEEIVVAHEKEVCVGLSEPREVFQMPSEKEGCQYGENHHSIHNENYEDRKSEAICVLPGTGSKTNLDASNWKTKMCLKWEMRGWCPYGNNCHFAHGSEELRNYGGGLVNTEVESSSTLDAKPIAIPAKASVGVIRRLPNVVHKTGEIPIRKWKGPNKISKIYGDWIDDL